MVNASFYLYCCCCCCRCIHSTNSITILMITPRPFAHYRYTSMYSWSPAAAPNATPLMRVKTDPLAPTMCAAALLSVASISKCAAMLHETRSAPTSTSGSRSCFGCGGRMPRARKRKRIRPLALAAGNSGASSTRTVRESASAVCIVCAVLPKCAVSTHTASADSCATATATALSDASPVNEPWQLIGSRLVRQALHTCFMMCPAPCPARARERTPNWTGLG